MNPPTTPASRMRPLAALFLFVVAAGCRCNPTNPSEVKLRLKNTSGQAIFVDDTDGKLGLTVQRNVDGMLFGFEDAACNCRSCDEVCSGQVCSCKPSEGPF